MNIDAHQHFWKYEPVKHIWINDDMAVLKKDYLPKDLEKEFEGSNIQGSVAVQASQSEDETTFLINLANENNFIKAIVGWADLSAPNISDRLSYFTELNSKVKGFRHVVHDEPDVNFLLRKNFQRGISELSKYNLTYDLLIYPIHMQVTETLVKSFPNQKFVIDHIAKPYIKKGDIELWEKHIKILAQYENVWCKLSGMVTESHWGNWKQKDFKPYLDVVLEAFGTDRLLFGSDWPVCLLSASYGEVKGIVYQYISDFSKNEKNKIMGANAIQFYGIIV